MSEKIQWHCHTTIETWTADQAARVAAEIGRQPTGADMRARVTPQRVEIPGNLALNEGITTALKLICGIATTAFDAANARLGVGDGTTAVTAADTDLSGAQTLYKGMNPGYPQVAGQTMTFQADFLSDEANFDWQEWSVDNGAASGDNLNRKLKAVGVKAAGSVKTMTVDITLA